MLVLSPTRELATQIGESFKTYGRHLGLSVTVIFGGVKYGGQMRAMAPGVDVLGATPGRLSDHLQEKTVTLEGVEMFVLDEADQMLDMGFIVPIRRIVKHLAHKRQNLFFSATMPSEIGKLAGELLKDPLQVSVTPQATTVERIRQQVLFVEQQRKRALLAELFAEKDFKRVIVFTRTKRGADRVAKSLEQGGGEAAAHELRELVLQVVALFEVGRVDLGRQLLDIGDVLRVRVLAWVGGIDPVDIGQQDQQVRTDQLGYTGGEPVVVAIADLVGDDGVILVDDRHRAHVQ